MLIPLKEIVQKYNLNIKGVIQVGAHWAEEHEIYVWLGINYIAYIEPCEEAFNILCKMFDGNHEQHIRLIHGGCGDKHGTYDMFVSNDNQGQSNSILKPKLHLQQHPEVRFTEIEKVEVAPLDFFSLVKGRYNLLVMDVQGAEGLVLKGATETLKHIDCIYTEVNRAQTYEENMEIEEMDEYLKQFGFERVETKWASDNLSWGDSCYIRKTLL